ncbi:hypothetical protein JH06_3990 [Blastocystis sp. subtype 4]|uniref:hypothetical protein n=1 Tax=Blastocystis sp. subtype 4 TaxID=944170 RepID=UPI000711686A|nr:hypothetical protein JH06_3990 [Blastocystis sp. subtype 4]KNB46268.1 hypothetical protein JH06_3990 [Blastocystis sp. subtype 4]|eukprot:XP_014529709.1 hypothetical protein JH06_3990 [Blastocystis sp. subtype 4]
MKYSHHSSIEELVSQQLQRNEMDGINQIRFAATPSIPKNYASQIAMTNAAWSPEDVGMLLFAMYRVLFQSRPDAPNDMMIQIPVTCFILLPIMVTHFVGKLITPLQLQDGMAVKSAMRQLAYYTQQTHRQTIIRPEIVSIMRRKSAENGSLNRRFLIFTIIKELDTEDACKLFYLKSFLRCFYFAVPSIRNDFLSAFTLFFAEQVESSLVFEQSCNVGELSQMVINTRNMQHDEMTDHNRSDPCVFLYHRQMSYLFFIRPFPIVLLNSILGLFRSSIILSSFSMVSKCLYNVILTQPELANVAARFFVKAWPWKDSSREVLFLRQVECTLFIIPADYQRSFFSIVFPNAKAALTSPNRFVSLQSLQMLIRIIQSSMAILSSKMVQGISEALSNLQNHWCDSVRQYGNICLRNLLLKAELRDSSSSEEFRGRSEAFTS